MEGKGEGEVISDGGCCLVVDEGRYLAYNGETGEYYLSNKPQPIKGGRATRSWYGARRFIIDDGSGDSFDKVAVGVIRNEGGKVLVAGDRIKDEEVEEEAGADVRFIPPFVMKCLREKPENVSYAKVFREGWLRLKAQMLKAGYKDDDDDEDVDLETYFPDDKDFYVKLRDRIGKRIREVGERHYVDDSGDEDDELELTSDEDDEFEITSDEDKFEFMSVEEDSDDDDDGEDDEDDDGDDCEDDDDDDDGGGGEDDESHEDKQSICYMDQDMEDSEDMHGAVTSDMKQLNHDTTYCRDIESRYSPSTPLLPTCSIIHVE